MSRLLIISLDAVSSDEFDHLCTYPNTKAFVKDASMNLSVQSVFLSNTYPVHASISTGKMPREHGLTSNTEAFPHHLAKWKIKESDIKGKTIWQAAARAGLSVATVFWPSTGGSKHIRYNIPEIPFMRNTNLPLAYLKEGHSALVLRMMIRHSRHLAKVVKALQPGLDSFITACAADLLEHKKPDLTMVHLTAYDTLRHKYGGDKQKLKAAYRSLDRSLGILRKAAGEDVTILILSDHGQFDVHTAISPNEWLRERGLLHKKGREWKKGASGCFFECCAGSAFFHSGSLRLNQVAEIKELVEQSEGFARFLTPEERTLAGKQNTAFGFAAKKGYMYGAEKKGDCSNHGYPLDYPGYEVFYGVKGEGFLPEEKRCGGSLLDIAPLAAKILKIDW
ncbi:alkaline phosphatase family protein [Clostridia bacterium]|nr:alkaline phosphatase family protein [Clostridia bacterium]